MPTCMSKRSVLSLAAVVFALMPAYTQAAPLVHSDTWLSRTEQIHPVSPEPGFSATPATIGKIFEQIFSKYTLYHSPECSRAEMIIGENSHGLFFSNGVSIIEIVIKRSLTKNAFATENPRALV